MSTTETRWTVNRNDPTIVLDDKGRPKCEVYGDGKEEREQHARYIAAAPDLLAACREAEVLLAKLVEMDRIPANNAAMRMARAAIAKATA